MSLIDGLANEARARLKRREQPDRTSPMLATLTHDVFSDDAWVFERKLDGERCIAFRRGGSVRLRSRNDKPLNDTYPEIVEALEEQSGDDFIVDGEIVAFEGSTTSFSRLQQRMQIHGKPGSAARSVAVYFYVFDLLHLEGYDTTRLALRDRKRLLRDALSFRDPLRFTVHRNTDGEAFYREACSKGWEGLIAKRAHSPYAHTRSKDWLKFKCVREQEFVIGGFTDPKGSRPAFGALLLGYYDTGALVYAGQVGTGFDHDTLRRLKETLAPMQRDRPPFDKGAPPASGVHWVEPELVAQCGFTEWTVDGKLRHPRFLGLRRDKPAREVVRED